MSILIKRSKQYPETIKRAYRILVEYRRRLEDEENWEYAKIVELAYKDLWCEALNETPPWK